MEISLGDYYYGEIYFQGGGYPSDGGGGFGDGIGWYDEMARGIGGFRSRAAQGLGQQSFPRT